MAIENSKKKIGFDFDKVFVSYPPVIPDILIDYLYKGNIVLKKGNDFNNLKYRMPGFLEQQLRIFSHNHIFRPPLKNNIKALRKLRKNSDHKLYLISSRFGFLKDQTNAWLDRQKLRKDFDGIHFNFENKQPHIFKENVIKKLQITHYVDDDLDLLVYLSKKMPENNFFWITDKKNHSYKNPKKNIIIIKSIKNLFAKYL